MEEKVICDFRMINYSICNNTRIVIINSLSQISNKSFNVMIIDPRLDKLNLSIRKGGKSILAIGSFDSVNTAALACYQLEECDLQVIPIPLVSDAFCMGRCTLSYNKPSIQCKRPSHIYLTLEENKKLGFQYPLLGLGEALSTICSLKESIKYNKLDSKYYNIINKINNFILLLTKNALKNYNENNEFLYRSVFSALLTKCSIAINFGSNEHIARSDHSLGRVIEREFKVPHGAAVLLACNLLAPYILSKNEEKIIKKVYNILKRYFKNLPESYDISQFIINEAIRIRPLSRHPLLLDLTNHI